MYAKHRAEELFDHRVAAAQVAGHRQHGGAEPVAACHLCAGDPGTAIEQNLAEAHGGGMLRLYIYVCVNKYINIYIYIYIYIYTYIHIYIIYILYIWVGSTLGRRAEPGRVTRRR